MADVVCRRCRGAAVVRNGMVRGEQRWRCKTCGYNFVAKPARGRPLAQKLLAVQLYLLGLSFNAIGRLLRVSAPAVLNWVRRFAEQHAAKPEPGTGRVVVMELDEMWHYLKKSPIGCGSGRLTLAIRASWLTGNAAIAIETR